MRIWVCVFITYIKTRHSGILCTPRTQHWEQTEEGKRWILRSHWPLSPTKLMSSRFSEKSCLKVKKWQVQKDTKFQSVSDLVMYIDKHVHTQTHTCSMPHAHASNFKCNYHMKQHSITRNVPRRNEDKLSERHLHSHVHLCSLLLPQGSSAADTWAGRSRIE